MLFKVSGICYDNVVLKTTSQIEEKEITWIV